MGPTDQSEKMSSAAWRSGISLSERKRRLSDVGC